MNHIALNIPAFVCFHIPNIGRFVSALLALESRITSMRIENVPVFGGERALSADVLADHCTVGELMTLEQWTVLCRVRAMGAHVIVHSGRVI